MTHGARWLLWLLPAAALATDLATCSRKWVKMNDRNYNRAIRHYSDCVLLGQALDPPARLEYESNIIMNLRKTCNYFFNRSSLPTSNLIGVVREVARILEDFDEELVSEPKNFFGRNVHKSLSTSLPPLAGQRLVKTGVTCLTRSTTKTPNTCILQDSNSYGYLLLMLVFFLLLITFQIAFLFWFCCCNHCMCLQLCRSDTRFAFNNLNNDGISKTELSDTFHLSELHDLASLSSENVGSDSEFEALLKMNKVPKAKRPFHSKEVD